MLIQMYQWEFKSIWSKDIDESDNFYSSISGFGSPSLDRQDGKYFGGSDPTRVNILITKSHYASYIDYTERSGYRVNYQSLQSGSTMTDREIGSINNETMHFQLGNPDINTNFLIEFNIHLS